MAGKGGANHRHGAVRFGNSVMVIAADPRLFPYRPVHFSRGQKGNTASLTQMNAVPDRAGDSRAMNRDPSLVNSSGWTLFAPPGEMMVTKGWNQIPPIARKNGLAP
jgi:hypothetical protein